MDAITDVPLPANEPIHEYAPGSGERTRLTEQLRALAQDPIDLPHVIGGTHRMGGGQRVDVVQPHRHSARLGTFTNAEHSDASAAIEAAIAAKAGWEATPFDERAAVFLRAADLLAGPWREKLAAATMLGQSKTAYQAEIDTPCELIDFWRFNVAFARQILARAADQLAAACGTAPTTVRWRASSTRSPRSTSPRSRATCRPRPR